MGGKETGDNRDTVSTGKVHTDRVPDRQGLDRHTDRQTDGRADRQRTAKQGLDRQGAARQGLDRQGTRRQRQGDKETRSRQARPRQTT